MKGKKNIFWVIIAALIVAADRLVKYIVASSAKVGETLLRIPFVDITYVQNKGAAFSIMSGKMSFLTIISIAFCAAVVVYWIKKKPSHPLLCAAVTMMFSGALGNAIDRIARGFVVDFICVTFVDFPVFNIADIGITVGAALLILYVIVFDKEDKNAKIDN